jgi:hypothetical protein
MTLVGGVATVTILSGASLARPPAQAAFLRRLAFATTLIVVWPGLVATLLGGHWTLSREQLGSPPPGWTLVGIAVTDLGIPVVLVLTLVVWLSQRRPRLGRAFALLAALYLAALFVAVWAMSAKPGS